MSEQQMGQFPVKWLVTIVDRGKGEAALKTLLDGQDLVYIHVEAPDECGHHGDLEGKIRSIELIDEEIVGPLLAGLEKAGEEYSILVMPDHPTPVSIKTHISDQGAAGAGAVGAGAVTPGHVRTLTIHAFL